MLRPQTIQIFLPAGDPRGMRVAEITTRIVRVIEVPRSQLTDFLKLPEAQQVRVYFLMGDLSEAGLPRAYIGQSGKVGARLVQHNQNKDFWNRALVVISLTNSLTQTHALFLEWLAIAEATKAGRYSFGMSCITPHGAWEHGSGGLRRCASQRIATAIRCKTRLASHPDPHYTHSRRVMQDIPQERQRGLAALHPRATAGRRLTLLHC